MFGKNVGLVLLGSFGTAAWLATSASHAQIVDVSPGGVHVRAPFVSVDVFRGGGVHVRAPYAAVDVGGRPFYNGPPPYVVERANTSRTATNGPRACRDGRRRAAPIRCGWPPSVCTTA